MSQRSLPIPTDRLPPYATALLRSLHFSDSDPSQLEKLRSDEWQALLAFCDQSQLTLLVGSLGARHLPPHIAARIAKNSRDNAERFARLQSALTDIGHAFSRNEIALVLLKGATHGQHFTPDPLVRSQGDIDLWCKPDQVEAGRRLLEALGYRAFGRSKGRHLDPMIRERSWAWTGDYFAPDLPIPVDLHYQLWDAKREFMTGPDEFAVWNRCGAAPIEFGSHTRQLCLPDRLLFAALHSLMHLLHGDLRLQRAWEIGYFLHHRVDDHHFWRTWEQLYSGQLLQLQTVMFVLVERWFGCAMPDRVRTHAQHLPPAVRLWIRDQAWSPVESLFSPNKQELWLNLALLDSRRAKSRILLRRLVPFHALELPSRSARQSLVRRVRHHVCSFPGVCLSLYRHGLNPSHEFKNEGAGNDASRL